MVLVNIVARELTSGNDSLACPAFLVRISTVEERIKEMQKRACKALPIFSAILQIVKVYAIAYVSINRNYVSRLRGSKCTTTN